LNAQKYTKMDVSFYNLKQTSYRSVISSITTINIFTSSETPV
jgi:hypothetical protein